MDDVDLVWMELDLESNMESCAGTVCLCALLCRARSRCFNLKL